MTAEANECSVSCEGSKAEFEGKRVLGLDPEGDLKGSGDQDGIACREGEENDGDAIDDSFVMVNGDSDDPTEGDLDLEEKLDPVGAEVAEPAVGEKGVPPVDAGSALKEVVVGDREASEGKGEKRASSVENGYDYEEGVVPIINSESEAAGDAINQETVVEGEKLCAEKGENGELCDRHDEKESCLDVENNAEHLKESGGPCGEKGDRELCREEEKMELGLENGHGHLEGIDAEVELFVKVEEKREPQTVANETDHQKELASVVQETQEPEAAVAETSQEAELEVEEQPESVVTETSHEEELYPAVEDKQQPMIVIAEINQQAGLESALKVEDQEAETAVANTSDLVEPESAVKVEEKQQPHTDIGEVDGQEEPEPIHVERRKEIEIAVPEANVREEFESVEVDKQEARTVVTDEQAEPESVEMEEKQLCHAASETDYQKTSESVHVEEEEHATEIAVSETNDHEGSTPIEVTENEVVALSNGAVDFSTDEPSGQFEKIVEVKGSESVQLEEKHATGLADYQEVSESVHVEEEHVTEIAVSETDDHEGSTPVEVTENEVVGLSNGAVDFPTDEPSDQLERVAEGKGSESVQVEEKHVTELAVSETNDYEGSSVEVTENEVVGLPDGVVGFSPDEPSDQLEVAEVTNIQTGDGNESPESGEAKSICDVDSVESTAEISGDSLENSESMPADHVDIQLESEARIIPLESSNNPGLCHFDDKEIENPACSVDDKSRTEYENGLVESGELEDEVCEGVSDSEKDVAIDTSFIEDHTRGEVELTKEIQTPPEESSGSAFDGERSETHVVKWQPCFIIRIPRFSDEELKTKLHLAKVRLDEKTQSRDSIRVAVQKKKATFNEHREKLEAARAEERSARAAVSAKRQEIDSIQSIINKIKNASSIDDIDDKIHNMEHTLEHETMTLPQEKQYIRDIKQLRQLREQLSSNMGPPKEIQEAFDQKDQIEERFKTLKKELDSLRTNVLPAEANVKAARKKFDDEFQLLKDLQEQFRAADNLRQEAYGHFQNLRKESFEKSKYFGMYKADQQTAESYAFKGDREGLRSHCSKQVERVMEIWNNNEEFRKQYVKSNMYSTLRRLRTSDGRSLGPDEEPPILRSNVDRSSSNVPLPLSSDSTPVPVLDLEVKDEKSGALAAPEKVAQTNQPAKLKKSIKPTSTEIVKAMVSNSEEVEGTEGEIKQTKEEEELARKAEELARKEEELRKEKAAAELKERCRQEQRAKAKEAEERKRRKAEKAQAKAEYKAQKEAELREKKRAKKEKKKATSVDASNEGIQGDTAHIADTISPESAREPEVTVRTASRRSSRQPAAVKQYDKLQPLPLPLRNRGKRKMQTWMWILLTTLLVLVLFLAGNYVSFSQSSLPNFGF